MLAEQWIAEQYAQIVLPFHLQIRQGGLTGFVTQRQAVRPLKSSTSQKVFSMVTDCQIHLVSGQGSADKPLIYVKVRQSALRLHK